MKILAISIKNLASLEGATRIDFTQEPLCSAGIFAITGPTGAGKSTILDAICLAFYGKTPRYLQGKETGIDVFDTSGSTIAQGDVRGILRDGTTDGYAEVDFVGIDGKKYRASWKVKRAYNRVGGALQGETLTLTDLNSGLPFPGRKTEILKELERLVGLNFEQFTRSVLLAQGDFTAFLKASKEEKAALLEKLTGNYIYSEISMLVYNKFKAAEQTLLELIVQKEAFPFLDNEQRELLEQKQILLDQQIVAATMEVTTLEQEHLWHLRKLEFENAVNNAAETLNKASGQKEIAAPRYTRLQRINEVQQCRTWVEARANAVIQRAHKTSALEALAENAVLLTGENSTAQTALDLLNASLLQAKNNRLTATPLLEHAKRLDILITERCGQAESAEKLFNEAGEKKAAHDLQENEKKGQVDLLWTRIKNLEAWKKNNSHRGPLAEHFPLISSKLSDAAKMLSAKQQVQVDLKENEDTLETTTGSITVLSDTLTEKKAGLAEKKTAYESKSETVKAIAINELNKRKAAKDVAVEDVILATAQWRLLARELSDQKTVRERLKNNQSTAENKGSLLTAGRKTLADAKIQKDTSVKILNAARLKVADNVLSLRGTLTANEACPVCGSLEHPYTLHEPVLVGVLAGIEQECEQYEKAYEAHLQTVSKLSNELSVLKDQNGGDEKTLREKTILIIANQEKWSKFQVYATCNAIADTIKEIWLIDKTQLLKREQKLLLDEIADYHRQKQSVDTAGKEIAAEELKIADINKNLEIKSQAQQTLISTIARLKRELLKSDGDLNALWTGLKPHFHQADWFEKWEEDPEIFLEQLTQFADLWREQTAQLEADSGAVRIASAELAGLQQQSAALQSAVTKTSATFE